MMPRWVDFCWQSSEHSTLTCPFPPTANVVAEGVQFLLAVGGPWTTVLLWRHNWHPSVHSSCKMSETFVEAVHISLQSFPQLADIIWREQEEENRVWILHQLCGGARISVTRGYARSRGRIEYVTKNVMDLVKQWVAKGHKHTVSCAQMKTRFWSKLFETLSSLPLRKKKSPCPLKVLNVTFPIYLLTTCLL